MKPLFDDIAHDHQIWSNFDNPILHACYSPISRCTDCSLLLFLLPPPHTLQERRIDLQNGRIIDCVWEYPDGCFQKEFIFRGAESLDKWVVSTDRDWGEGFSKAELAVSKNNMALFQGHLCTDLPKEGNSVCLSVSL